MYCCVCDVYFIVNVVPSFIVKFFISLFLFMEELELLASNGDRNVVVVVGLKPCLDPH